jgi:hypothetical protein
MLKFKEIHGDLFTEEQEKQFMEEYIKLEEEKNERLDNAQTENDNEGDILGDNYSTIVNSINKNKIPKKIKIQNQEEKTKDTSTLIGRKTKDSTRPSKHGADAEDNKRDKKIRSAVSYLKEKADGECKKCNVETFKHPNIKDQFGSSFVQNKFMLSTKLYKIICFQKEFKKDTNVIHKDKGLINKNIIMQMLEKENNEFFIYLMKANLSDYEEIGEKIKTHLSLDENDEKLNAFKDTLKSLINQIEEKMVSVKKNEFKPVNYITIEELED